MKKVVTLLFLILLCQASYGQVNKEELYGKWTVEKVEEKPKETQFLLVIDGFEKSTFVFNQDGSFSLTTTSKSELFSEVTKMIKGTKWIYEESKQIIRIGNKADGYSIMGITVKKDNGKTIFNLLESEIVLQMNKVE